MFNLFGFMDMAGNYEDRKVGKISPEDNGGIGVSTCFVTDMDLPYETALLDAENAHPVERYETKEEAIKGHRRWVKKARTAKTCMRLGSEDYGVKNEKVRLVRVK